MEGLKEKGDLYMCQGHHKEKCEFLTFLTYTVHNSIHKKKL